LEGLIPTAVSPLQASVGAAFAEGTMAPNLDTDVRYVQLLLNDWRGRAGLPLIGENGLVGDETRSAIGTVQETFMEVPDERVDPAEGTIALLEAEHLRAVFAAGRIVDSELMPDPANPEEVNFLPTMTRIPRAKTMRRACRRASPNLTRWSSALPPPKPQTEVIGYFRLLYG